MRESMEYERSNGRDPQDVSAENLGYDIRSLDSPPGQADDGDGTVRYIEVKARAETGPIAMTPNEWFMAQRLTKEYWLYVVENAASNPKLYTIPDPAAKLEPEEVVGVVRYLVKDWKEHA